MKKAGKFLFLSISLFLFFTIAACNSNSTVSNTTTTIASTTSSTIPSTTNSTISAADAAILTYADPETETTLQGLSEDNLAKYTQYGDSAFNAALTQAVLDKSTTEITGQYGAYVSKEFQSTDQQQGYILVYYTAKFTKGAVTVEMVFDTNHQVAGQWFK